jgi:hypothetical protein
MRNFYLYVSIYIVPKIIIIFTAMETGVGIPTPTELYKVLSFLDAL